MGLGFKFSKYEETSMSKSIDWVVYEEEKQTRKWVNMPKEWLGIPLFEHATDYISILDSGEKVMVSKKDGYVFPNSGVSSTDKNHLATPEEIEKMRAEAKRKAEERRRNGLQRTRNLGVSREDDYRLYDSAKRSSRRDTLSQNTKSSVSVKTIAELQEKNYDKRVPWEVDYQSSGDGLWLTIPLDYKGQIVTEYWNTYRTTLRDGRSAMVDKVTGDIISIYSTKSSKEEEDDSALPITTDATKLKGN